MQPARTRSVPQCSPRVSRTRVLLPCPFYKWGKPTAPLLRREETKCLVRMVSLTVFSFVPASGSFAGKSSSSYRSYKSRIDFTPTPTRYTSSGTHGPRYITRQAAVSHRCMEHLRIFIAWMTPSGQRLPREVAALKRQLAAGQELFSGA